VAPDLGGEAEVAAEADVTDIPSIVMGEGRLIRKEVRIGGMENTWMEVRVRGVLLGLLLMFINR
jgi:hypothetical protein